jgi:hypothetical protein
MLIVWDLCSGYGGFSEAFYIKSMFPAREYEVFRFENNPDLAQVPKTYLEDVCSWMDWVEKYPAPDIILASPPCLEFSLGYNGPRSKAQRAGEDYEPDMSLVDACLDIVEHFKPQIWILENVAGATTYFREHEKLGDWEQRIGPFFFWGTFPRIISGYEPGEDSLGKTAQWNIGDPLRANKRAIIPLKISRGILEAFEQQWTLRRWI